jgi:hypothetical protein
MLMREEQRAVALKRDAYQVVAPDRRAQSSGYSVPPRFSFAHGIQHETRVSYCCRAYTACTPDLYWSQTQDVVCACARLLV